MLSVDLPCVKGSEIQIIAGIYIYFIHQAI